MYFYQRIEEKIGSLPAHVYLRRYQGFSGLLCKRLRLHGQALCNGRPLRMIDAVHEGDLLELHYPEEGEAPVDWRAPEGTACPIVYQDAYYILVNKPAGWLSHPNFVGDTGPSVTAFFTPYQLHLVSRLDRGTEGLMLLARSGYAHYRLLHEGQPRKGYRAYVLGQVQDAGSWDWPIGRLPGSIVQRCHDPAGKPAQTDYWPLEHYGPGASQIGLRLHSGRTHQIRLHGQLGGHALVGESLYPPADSFWEDLAAKTSPESSRRLEALSQNFGRQALQASELSFWHPFLKRELNFSLGASAELLQLETELRRWAQEIH